jgi:L-rhamnose isomerase
MKEANILKAYEFAKEQFAGIGVDAEAAMKTLETVPISLHCWQGDDVGGFENAAGLTGGGIQATGNYPGKARTARDQCFCGAKSRRGPLKIIPANSSLCQQRSRPRSPGARLAQCRSPYFLF